MKKLRLWLLAHSLFTRITLLIAAGLLIMVLGMVLLSRQTVNESVERTLQERLVIARITAERLDGLLQGTTNVLRVMVSEAVLDPAQPGRPQNSQALHAIGTQMGSLAHYVALVDRRGMVVWTEPYLEEVVGSDLSDGNCIQKVLGGLDSITTKVFTLGSTEPTAAIMAGLKSPDGSVPGLVYVALNLSHPDFASFLKPLGVGQTGYAEIVDENGVILASTWPQHLWQQVDHRERLATLIRDDTTMVGTCHNCHTADWTSQPDRQEDVIAFAPLATAPWGVMLRQSQAEAMAYNRVIEQRMIFFGAGFFLVALAGTALSTRSLVQPLQALSRACRRIAAGNLAEAIPPMGSGEIRDLAQSFDAMREQLQASRHEIEAWNQELEQIVEQRTGELVAAEHGRRQLLRKLVAAQEEERRRLARELHDDTSQALTALAVGLETTMMAPATCAEEVKQRLAVSKALALDMQRELQRIILDLRPAILDDLGLVPAIDWYAESRLASQGVQVQMETVGEERRLPSEVETTVFRVAQEAITNIARHARAECVTINLAFTDTVVSLEFEDDGCGFDPEAVMNQGKGSTLSFGLLGMRERVALFGGKVQIHSQPGQGTRVSLEIPWQQPARNGKNGRNGKGEQKDSSFTGRRPCHPERRAAGITQPE